jgi:hypothetical protein
MERVDHSGCTPVKEFLIYEKNINQFTEHHKLRMAIKVYNVKCSVGQRQIRALLFRNVHRALLEGFPALEHKWSMYQKHGKE